MTEVHPIDYMAMWEAFLDVRAMTAENPDLDKVWDDIGSVGMRVHAAEVAKAADAFWKTLSPLEESDLSPYDWEFCPAFLSLVKWEAGPCSTDWRVILPTDHEIRTALLPGSLKTDERNRQAGEA